MLKHATDETVPGFTCPACGLFSPTREGEIVAGATHIHCPERGSTMASDDRPVYTDEIGARYILNPVSHRFEALAIL
jgi:hypothetical protein